MGHQSLRSVPGIQQRLCKCYSRYFVVVVRRLRGPWGGASHDPRFPKPAACQPLSLRPTCLGARKGLHLWCWHCPTREVATPPYHGKPGTQ